MIQFNRKRSYNTFGIGHVERTVGLVSHTDGFFHSFDGAMRRKRSDYSAVAADHQRNPTPHAHSFTASSAARRPVTPRANQAIGII